MLPRGRPPGPGTAEEKAAIRREKVRLNVKAYRERKKQGLAVTSTTSPSWSHGQHGSSRSESDEDIDKSNTTSKLKDAVDESSQVIVRSKVRHVNDPRATNSKLQPKNWAVLWSTPDNSLVFTEGFLTTFRNAFLPPRVNLPTESYEWPVLVTPCSPWIISAYSMAAQQDHGALKSGVLAIGLIINGLGHNNTDLRVASLQMQRQAICQLRSELEPISLQRKRRSVAMSAIEPYLSCLAVSMFEMIQVGFTPAFLKHISALNSLIELMFTDPDVDKFRVDLIIEDFGMLESIFCLKYGTSSVLRKTRLKLGSKKSGDDGKIRKNASVYGDILDIVDELPSLLVRVQTAQNQPYSKAACHELQQTIHRLIRIEGDLDAWSIQFEVRHGPMMVEETFLDDASGQNGVRPRLASYEHGAAGMYIFNSQLYALEANIQATTRLAQMQQHDNSKAGDTVERITGWSNIWDGAGLLDSTEKSHQPQPRVVPIYHNKGMLYERVKAQRVKVRSIVIRLVELMDHFWQSANNLTGQALLILPREKAKEVLEKEQARIQQDFQFVAPGDQEGMKSVKKIMGEMASAGEVFKQLESKMRQSDFGSFHST